LDKYEVSNLISMKPVRADRTLREFDQFLRVDFRVEETPPIRIQLLFDRIHLKNPKLSKPVGYLHFSENTQLIDLIKNLTTALIVKTIISKYRNPIYLTPLAIEELVNRALNTLWKDLIEQDVKFLSRHYINRVIEKMMELKSKNVDENES